MIKTKTTEKLVHVLGILTGMIGLLCLQGSEYHLLKEALVIKNKNMPESMFIILCPFVDLFRTTRLKKQWKYSTKTISFQEFD
jgi:hypothetical protein